MFLRLIINLHIKPFILLLGVISLSSGLVYRFYALNWAGIAFSLVLTALFFIILWYFGQKFNLKLIEPFWGPTEGNRYFRIGFHPYASAFLAFWLLAIILLVRSGTSDSIVSPWQAVSLWILGAYFLASLALLVHFGNSRSYQAPLIALHYALSFSIIIFVYRLGYGYDFFVHQATLELIDKAGLVLPKSNYYAGQYGLIMMLHRLIGLPLYWVHLLLVPLLSALLLPAVVLRWFEKMELKSSHRLLALALLVLPYGVLTFTTPQNLAYLFLIIVLAMSWRPDRFDLITSGVLSCAAVIIQPIAGLPAVILTVWRAVDFLKLKRSELAHRVLLALSIFGLPLAFAGLEKLDMNALAFAWPDWLPNSIMSLPDQELIGWNSLYLIGNNWYWIILVLVSVGFAWRKESAAFYQEQKAATALAGAFLLAHWLTKLLPFNFLIGYERDDYAARLLTVALIFSLPLILKPLERLFVNLSAASMPTKGPWLVFLAGCLTAVFYLSYPRLDRYANSRGYSVGKFDIEAARWIDQDSQVPYIVLANQQVSAAALREFGFAHYYNDLFYYPVPTASPLYQTYLKMVYEKPAKETAREAAEMTGVKTVYFVLNKYWYAFPKVMDEAKAAADEWRPFGENETVVFKYEF
ncbi:hypothetical protein HGA34_01125 [Candidatus Falkowbacteria bacterium]|nr:hypothetical protein [Candidatus Falkowbacteria bacterium]